METNFWGPMRVWMAARPLMSHTGARSSLAANRRRAALCCSGRRSSHACTLLVSQAHMPSAGFSRVILTSSVYARKLATLAGRSLCRRLQSTAHACSCSGPDPSVSSLHLSCSGAARLDDLYSQQGKRNPIVNLQGCLGAWLPACSRGTHRICTPRMPRQLLPPPMRSPSSCSLRTQRNVEALAEAWMTEMEGKESDVKVTVLYPG